MEGLIFGGSYMYIGRTLYMEGPIYRWPYMWRALYAKGFICKGPTQRALYMDQDLIYGGPYIQMALYVEGLICKGLYMQRAYAKGLIHGSGPYIWRALYGISNEFDWFVLCFSDTLVHDLQKTTKHKNIGHKQYGRITGIQNEVIY